MSEPRKPRKPWAVLAYTVADDRGGGSTLDRLARQELKAICDATNWTDVSVAAQVDFKRPKGVFRGAIVDYDTRGGFKNVDPDEHPLWRQIVKDVDRTQGTLKVQEETRDLSSAQRAVLEEFLTFGRAECPADRYVVSFFGHAYGPIGMFCDRATGQRDTDTLRLNDLAGSITQTTGRAAIVIFRDCFMGTLETAFQLRKATEYMVATQALAPAEGVWPWHDWMSSLGAGTTLEVGVGLTQRLGAFLDEAANRSGFGTVPYSLLDTSGAEGAASILEVMVQTLEAARADAALSRAVAAAFERARVGSPESADTPGDPALIDVLTLCDGLSALDGTAVAAPAKALGEIVRSQLVRFHHSQSPAHKGVALFYKPVRAADVERSYLQATDETVAADDAAQYRALALSKATRWDRIALNPFPVAD